VFHCGCSQRRAEEVLRLLGEEETRAACEEQGRVVVTCEYCGKEQRFDPIDISRIFAGQSLSGSAALH
jgi:molecular chaperone Hsp33